MLSDAGSVRLIYACSHSCLLVQGRLLVLGALRYILCAHNMELRRLCCAGR